MACAFQSPDDNLAAAERWHDLTPWLLLSMVPGIGPLLQRELIGRFDTAAAVLSASPAELRQVPGLGPKLCQAIGRARETIDVAAEVSRCQRHGIRLVLHSDAHYPEALRHIPDPPAVLYQRGMLLSRDRLAVAVVGTRHATHYGRKQARRIAASLARAGVTIVSGLARGIDTVAHQAALEVGGRTIAILGGGLLNMYPPENKELADLITSHGAVLSESPTLARPGRGTFPRRNRIVTGLCQGVVVVEAGDRSGALISARLSSEQGREVFAVPGPVDSRSSTGCHRLIRDGAKLVATAADVLEELGPLVQPAVDSDGHEVRQPAELMLNDLERLILDTVGNEPTSIDDLCHRCGVPIHRVLATISVLEMRHMVRRLSGTQIARV